eukprot:m.124218 g.124218  ORF g.124218 m.124218 type:complete len:100 (+) comp11149_c0_seq2:135-434(+)
MGQQLCRMMHNDVSTYVVHCIHMAQQRDTNGASPWQCCGTHNGGGHEKLIDNGHDRCRRSQEGPVTSSRMSMPTPTYTVGATGVTLLIGTGMWFAWATS